MNYIIKMNKQGGEKLLSIWWFMVLAIVAVGIVSGVLLFYSADYNSKELESSILAGKIENCLSGKLLNDKIIDTDYIYSNCGLNRSMFEENGFLYFKVSISDMGLVLKEAESGLKSIPADCQISSKISARHYPKCVEVTRDVQYYLDKKTFNAKMKILTGSNQNGGI